MRRLIKFLHTLGAIGLMGAMACLLVLLAYAPPPAQLAEYAALRGAMGGIATWILLPSLALTLVAGLIAMALNPNYQNAPWALVKLATGILVFEWGFAGMVGPMQEEAALAAKVLAGQGEAASLGQSLAAESGSLWVLMAIAALNVGLGVWRPRISLKRAKPAATDHASAASVVRDQSL